MRNIQLVNHYDKSIIKLTGDSGGHFVELWQFVNCTLVLMLQLLTYVNKNIDTV